MGTNENARICTHTFSQNSENLRKQMCPLALSVGMKCGKLQVFFRTQLKRGGISEEEKTKKKETEEPYNRRRLAERAEGRSYDAINTQYKETQRDGAADGGARFRENMPVSLAPRNLCRVHSFTQS